VCCEQDVSEYGGGDGGGDVAINVAAKVAELQQKIEEQALQHEDLLRQLESIRHGIVKDIVARHPDDAIHGGGGGDTAPQQGESPSKRCFHVLITDTTLLLP
jgi:hypothetical protein